ncbi:MAG: hypothetical protein O7I93_02890 [Gemmatimonadetes bacterium]|nr:hypothetical protein [Gemmatimonadota bacterium]
MRAKIISAAGTGLLIALAAPAQAQVRDSTGLGRLADSSRSGYKGPGGIGGAETIDAELEVANQVQESYFRLPVRVFKPWYYFGYGSSVSPTVNWPNQGAGIIGSVRPTEQLYINLELHDAGGDPFTSGEVFYFGEEGLANSHRISYTYAEENFGLVEVDWEAEPSPVVTLRVMNVEGAQVFRHEMALATLSASGSTR